jgi:hypothetical protein
VPGHIEAQAARSPWLKHVEFTDKLSHWGCKRVGVAASSGRWLLFLDAHVVPSRGSLEGAWEYLKCRNLKGTLHMPLSYHILEDKWLAYKPDFNPDHGYLGYSFTTFPGKLRGTSNIVKIPCMSTCGMWMPRKVYNAVGGWPAELGIYGGGENFMNYVLGILGFDKHLWCGGAVHHHGDKRGYNYVYDDYVRNRGIAMYCVGGEDWLDRFIDNARGNPGVLHRIQESILDTGGDVRAYIESKQMESIESWVSRWSGWSF